jgi:hypothetical protein
MPMPTMSSQGTELLEQQHIVAAIANSQPAETELLETTKTVRLKKSKKSS